MAEFYGDKIKSFKEKEPIIFENRTNFNFDVQMGIVFHKSGIYEVTITRGKTSVSKITGPKNGKWIRVCEGKSIKCSCCSEEFNYISEYINYWNYCPNCGADMRREL